MGVQPWVQGYCAMSCNHMRQHENKKARIMRAGVVFCNFIRRYANLLYVLDLLAHLLDQHF
ncbi:hypothetical protein E4G15_11870 [Salmonella enterica]|nr:hypothetical protein [Salmonella enterica]